ncbi:MAG: lipoprotein-releasing ABC transporter permease subunit [Zoogloeaceae bacterium]|jgi:lipoprotein-releasing system permease protein|nr:lipoprotein-releasing ABC transporter permease subunit [Zoogloeaceae bacterium]
MYELLIGLRYTRARRRNHFISFISFSSMLGVALGVTALIVVLSVMNGFQKELRTRILSVASHIQIEGAEGSLPDWAEVGREAKAHPDVLATAPYVQAQSMLAAHQEVRGVLVRGIEPAREEKVADFAGHMAAGRLESLAPGAFGIVLGSELARALRVQPGDKVTVIAPQGAMTPMGMTPRLKAFTVTGIFEVGMFEYDSGLALIHLNDAQRLYRLGDTVSGVRLKLVDLFAAPRVSRELAGMVNADAYLTDWTRSHANFFRAVQIEKNMMFIILSLIVAVAAFNIVSTLVMAVTDKEADIAILRTLGARPRGIMAIFMMQGALIGFIGLALGVAGGVSLALNIDVVVPFIERILGTQILAKDVYYISDLPSDLQWGDVLGVTAISFILALLATIYPSWRASRLQPAEALRYE